MIHLPASVRVYLSDAVRYAQICAVHCYGASRCKGMEKPRRASLGQPGELHIT